MQQIPGVSGQESTLIPQVTAAHRKILLSNTVISGNTLEQAEPILLFSHMKGIQICCRPIWTCSTGEGLKDDSCVNFSVVEDNRVLGTFLKGMTIFHYHIGGNPEYD